MNTKLAIFLTIFLLPVMGYSQTSKNAFLLRGKITGVKKGQAVVVILKVYDDNLTEDSVTVKNGTFKFSGKAAEPYWAAINVKVNNQFNDQTLNFFIEKGVTNLFCAVDSLNAAVITGSPLNAVYQTYKSNIADISLKKSDVYKQYYKLEELNQDSNQHSDTITRKFAVLSSQIDSVDRLQEIAEKQFIVRHPSSYLSLWLLSESYRHGLSFENTKSLFFKLSPAIRKSVSGNKLASVLKAESIFAIGRKLPDFTQPDSTGKNIALTNFRGKYVLVDFWASWCKPCRAENPNLKKAYESYHDRGFEVLGVSSDFQKGSWIKAMKTDSLTWINVFDQEGKVSKLYHIKSLPSNFLIDPNGKILSRNLRGEALNKKLHTIFTH